MHSKNKIQKKGFRIGDYLKNCVITNEDPTKEMKKNKFTLFASFLDREINHPEKKTISSPEEKIEYDKLAFLWDKCVPEEKEELDIWSKTERKIAANSEPTISVTRVSNRRMSWIRKMEYALMAASVALFIGVAYFFQKDDKRSNMEEIAQSLLTETTQEEVKEVTLVVSNEEKIVLNNNAKVIYSTTGEVQVNSDKLKETGKDAYNQIIVPKGKRSQIILADNSKIWINSGSKVIYPRSFEGKYREIFVEGEVYLQVAHNAEKPFIVNTSSFEVRVLGTSFNVSAYKGSDKASVVLVDGSVDVTDQNERRIKMVPNERVELNLSGIFGKGTVNVSHYVSWIDGIWTLKGETLGSTLQRLQEYYGQTIQCDASIENELIFGKLYLNDQLDQVLNSVITTLPIHCTTENNVIYVKRIK